MFKKVDAANLAYLKRLEGIMESEIGVLEPCPRCSDPFLGLIFPPMMKPVTADVRDAVLASVGEQPAQATLQTKYARRCEDCDGNGVVLTGSRTNRDKAIKCPECNGRGWIPVGDELRVGRPDVAPSAQGNGESTTVPITLAPSEPAPDTDLWGRKVGDPDLEWAETTNSPVSLKTSPVGAPPVALVGVGMVTASGEPTGKP